MDIILIISTLFVFTMYTIAMVIRLIVGKRKAKNIKPLPH